MMPSNLPRFAGPSAMLGGTLFVALLALGLLANFGALAGTFLESPLGYFTLEAPTMVLLAVGVAGLYAHGAPRFGKLGKAGFSVSLAGFSLAALGGAYVVLVGIFSGDSSVPQWLNDVTHPLAMLLIDVGSVLFAIAMLRTGLSLRGGALLLVASPLALAGMTAVGLGGLYQAIPSAMSGAGWVWLGYAVWSGSATGAPRDVAPMLDGTKEVLGTGGEPVTRG